MRRVRIGGRACSNGIGWWANSTSDVVPRSLMWELALARAVEQLHSAGSQVVVIHPVTKVTHHDPRGCSAVLWFLGPEACASEVGRSDALEAVGPVVAAERAVVKALAIQSLDPFDEICPDDPCSSVADGTFMFCDRGHITVAAAVGLTPRFDEAFADLRPAP